MAEFGDFIFGMELINFPTSGSKFIWFNFPGFSMSRLDHFLISDCLIDKWDLKGKFIGDRSIFDHCPIWIKANKLSSGPKLFVYVLFLLTRLP